MVIDWSKFDQAVFNTIENENLDSLERISKLSTFIMDERPFDKVDFSSFSLIDAEDAYWATYYYACDDGQQYDIWESSEGTEVNVYNLCHPMIEFVKKNELQGELVNLKRYKRKFI